MTYLASSSSSFPSKVNSVNLSLSQTRHSGGHISPQRPAQLWVQGKIFLQGSSHLVRLQGSPHFFVQVLCSQLHWHNSYKLYEKWFKTQIHKQKSSLPCKEYKVRSTCVDICYVNKSIHISANTVGKRGRSWRCKCARKPENGRTFQHTLGGHVHWNILRRPLCRDVHNQVWLYTVSCRW